MSIYLAVELSYEQTYMVTQYSDQQFLLLLFYHQLSQITLEAIVTYSQKVAT